MRRLAAAATIAIVLAAAAHPVDASQRPGYRAPTRTVWDRVYTDAQATRGQATYAQLCSHCHGDDLSGSTLGPPLKGTLFVDRWNGRTLFDLYGKVVGVMPHDQPTMLIPGDRAAEIIAFILQQNDIPAGDIPLAPTIEALTDIRMTRPSH